MSFLRAFITYAPNSKYFSQYRSCSELFPFLYQIFEPFGPVELVQLPLDLETGQCKGFGFIQVSRTRLIN